MDSLPPHRRLPSSNVILRHAGAGDREFLLALTARLADFPVPAWRTAAEIARADDHLIDAALSDTDADVLLLIAQDADGTRAGAVLVTTREDYFTHAHHAHVEVIAVLPEFAGRGIARLLMDAAEGWARERAYPHVTLNVFERNVRARGVYEHLGYVPETMHYFKKL